MKKLIYIFLFLNSFVYGQLTPLQSQYMFNSIALNPAFTGCEKTMSIVSGFRFQWTGINGAPTTQNITIHAPLKKTNSAIGIQLNSDQIGIDKNTGFFGLYSYTIKQKKSNLILGLAGGVNLRKSYYSKLEVNNIGDNLLIDDSGLGILPNVSFGAHFYTKKYFLSFAIPTLFTHIYQNSKFRLKNDFNTYNYTFGGGIIFKIGNQINIKPSVLIKYVYKNTPQFDFNLMAKVHPALNIGLSYRTSEALIALFKFNLNEQFNFMYSFGLPINDLYGYNFGSHELGLKYTFFYKTQVSNPRVLGW